jgi:hypothetical protein
VQLNIGGGSGTAGYICEAQYTDAASPTEADWVRMRSELDPPLYTDFFGSGAFIYTDREIAAGTVRKYRVRTVVNDPDNYVASQWSATSATTTSSIVPTSWWIISPEVTAAEAPSYRLAVKAAPGQTLTHSQRVHSSLPLDSGSGRGAIVTRTRPRARTQDISLWVLTEAEYQTLFRIIDDGRVFCVQDVLGRLMYCQLQGSPSETTLRTYKEFVSSYPVGHTHQITLPVVEVRRPPLPDLAV